MEKIRNTSKLASGVSLMALFALWMAVPVWGADKQVGEGAKRLSPEEVMPRDYYGTISKRLCNSTPECHVLKAAFNDEMSRRAWTNLVTHYDFNHTVFLQSDIAEFEPMQTQLDDALLKGDISFGYKVYRVFCKRVAECVNYATNLLATTEFDFTKREDYTWQRKDAPWPKDDAERFDLWRQRLKNELLSQIVGKELDAEQAERDKKKQAKRDAAQKSQDVASAAAKDAKGAATNETDEVKEPVLSPKENLIKRYRQYLSVITEPDEEVVLQRLLSAMTQSYDPHSDYMSPMRQEDFEMEMSLSLCGVGATLSMDDGALKIVEILPGGPIDRDKRIKKGDKIIGVGQGDGPIEDILYKPMRKTISKIRGAKGTRVTLEILPRTDPSGATRKRYTLVRDEIKLEDQAATGRVEKVSLGGVTNLLGYVKLPGFYGTMGKKMGDPEFRSCTMDVAKYIAQFNAQETDGMILDLRGNGGGSLREAVFLSALFLRPGPVVQIRETQGVGVLRIQEDMPNLAYRKPLIVMTDRASASASEIVAGVLQDMGRAIVVGDRTTHGKGTVQTVLPLGPENFGSMKITTARFYRISGSSTQVKGVEADIHLPSILDGLDIGEDKLPNALPWTRIEPVPYETIWNLGIYVPELLALSTERLKDNAEYKRHIRAVGLFRDSAERKSAPLDHDRRLKMMREEREMREIEDAGDAEDDEDPSEMAYTQSEKKDKKNDVVLEESFKILADLVRLTNRGEVPPMPERKIPAWLRALGEQ